MGLRTILITAGFAIVSTFGLAQRTAAAPAATTSTTTAATPAAPGETNVPVGAANAVGVGAAATTPTAVPTAIVVPTNATGFVGPSQSFPLASTPTLTFVNSPDGTTTVPVISYAGGPAAANAAASGSNANATNTGTQTADLNLGSVSSVSDLYGGDNRSVAEVARQYKARRNSVQNARVYTNADIARIRQQAGESSSSAVPASDQGTMPASDQSAEQNNQSTTPQVPQPAANQKPSPFAPKK